jgi:replicative DNA helicase
MTAHNPLPSIEIEQALLGAILMDGRIFSRVSEHVSEDDFAEELHRRVFGAMAAVANDSMLPGLMAVRPRLGEHELAEGVSTGSYLASLCAATGAGPALARDYSRQVRQFADRRRLQVIGADLAAVASAPGASAPAIAAEVISRLDPIIASARLSSVRRVTIGSAAQTASALAFDRMRGVPTKSIRTGLADLDSRIGGLEPGEYSILAGRPSMGKTALALEIACNVAKRGVGVLIFSLEMGADALAYRVLSSVLFDTTPHDCSPLYYSRIARGDLTTREAERVELANRSVAQMPLIIEPEAGLNMAQIGSRVRHVKEQLAVDGVDLGLIIIDHLGLVRASSRYSGSRTNEMMEISAGCKALSKEAEAHILALSQLNRGVESRSDKRPMLSDLRESGNLEQDADLVIGCYREAYYLQNSADPDAPARLLSVKNDLEAIVLKQRQGPIGSVMLYADMGANAIRGVQ